MNKILFERISTYLQDERVAKTPQEISDWLNIELSIVYDILQTNRGYFREIIINDTLIGWEGLY